MSSSSLAQAGHLDRLRCLEREVRAALNIEDGAIARKKVAEFSQTLAESSHALTPYDVQALLATQRELTAHVHKMHAARTTSTAFTFKKKPSLGGQSAPAVGPVGATTGATEGIESSKTTGHGTHRRDASPGTDHPAACVTHIDASSLDPASSSLVVENKSDTEVRIHKLDVLQQVRIRGCENVTFKLYYNDGQTAVDTDKVVVEASKGLSFGFYDEADGARIPRRTVRDFGWLRAGPSPNISWLDS